MRGIVYILVLFFIVANSFAQHIRFQHLTVNDGLPSDMVNTIHQDSEGFMWFGTNYGLCRYDGYDFLNIQHSIDDSCRLSRLFVTCLKEISNGDLWIGTLNGLYHFRRSNYSLIQVPGLQKIRINAMLLTEDEHLILGTFNNGLYKFIPNTGNITKYKNTEDPSSIIDNRVNDLILDPKRGILVGTRRGIDIFDPISESFTRFFPEVNIIHFSFYQDSSIFIAPKQPGVYYCLKNKFPERCKLPEKFSDDIVSLFHDGEQAEWMVINGKGVYYTDKKTSKEQLLSFDKHNPSGINSIAINCFFQDRIGNVWIGSFDAGASFLEKEGKEFIHVRDNFLPNGLRNNRVRSIYQDSEGDIWVGSKLNGTLAQFDKETMSFTHFAHEHERSHTISDDNIFAITEHEPGELWVGTSKGLNLFNKRTDDAKSFYSEPDNSNSLRSDIIYCLLKDNDDLLVGHVVAGLDVFNISENTFSNYLPNSKSSSLSDGKVRVLYKDSFKNIWVGTINGLNLFDKKSGTFTQYLNIDGDTSSISNNNILSIYEDKNQNLWIGTSIGLNLMDRDKGTFRRFLTKDNLIDNTINAIYADGEENLWLSTHHGILKFNPQLNTVKNYDKFDGVSSNELSAYSHFQTQNGEILFGSNYGFTLFHPDHIVENKYLPKVVLTDLKINNKLVSVNATDSPLNKHISQCKDITLNYKQTFVSFKYVALNCSSPEKNQYAYMLDGFDKDWNDVGNKREAIYTNLSQGTYTFRVKASNSDGVWSEEENTLQITVLPPPWLTWWAYSIYIAFLIGLVLLYVRYTTKRIREEQELEHSQQKLRFFLNVSHEFRTPITLILNPIKRILETKNINEAKDAAKSINISANKLMSLTNELLEFRKNDIGQAPLIYEKVDIVEYSRLIFNLFSEIGNEKGVQMNFTSSSSELEVWLDPDKYEKILNNLLSNALKFSNKGDYVELIIRKNSDTDFVEIYVKDSGIGIAVNQLEHIFERFYSRAESHSGTGIGLHYTKSLAEQHDGYINVESELEKGTTFIVGLPMGNNNIEKNPKQKKNFTINEHKFDTYKVESLRYDLASDEVDSPEMSEDVDSEIANQKKPVVLLVEDNRQLRNQLKQELGKIYQIKEAANGKEGFEKAEKWVPDLIISDVMMPVMDGIELCSCLKNNDDLAHIPIILLTARGQVEHQVEGFEIGADEYMPKPFHLDLLKSRIQNLLDSRRKLKEKFLNSGNVISTKVLSTNNEEEQFLDRITKLILENISNEEFGLQEIQDKMNMSRSALYKKVNALSGTSPSVFVRLVKLKYATELLKKNKCQIKEVCFQSGFSNTSYFNKIFKETYGVTPLQYRKKNL